LNVPDQTVPAPAPKSHPGWTLAIDYGPLVAFFVAYKFAGIFTGTAIFMVAMIAALVISRWKLGRISPMLWLSAILILGFGGLTVWFHNPKFIQLKPTIIYLLLGGLLAIGLVTGRPLLKYVLEAGYDGLTDRGWMILSRNWAIFFFAMAGFNEILRHTLDFDMWLTVKVWALPILSFAFALANIPILTKHGFGEAVAAKPPEG
jgi:intracellular septation protein